jgi:hypothetical protein
MSKIVKVSESDYRLIVKPTGTITLDTGVEVGTVRITGNLIVEGTQTTVNTTNLDIEDNIVRLNKNETGSGITLGFSGLEIERGTQANAQMVYKESTDKWIFQYDDNNLTGITVGSVGTNSGSNLLLDMSSGSGTIRVTNSTNYESRVTNPNDIPNKKYLDDYVSAGLVVVGQADVDRIYKGTGLPVAIQTEIIADLSKLQFLIRSGGTLNQRAQITSVGLDVDSINLYEYTIQSTSVVNNLRLYAANSHIEVDGVLNLKNQGSAPTGTGGTNRVYSQSTMGPGKSGLFFVNSTLSDELVAKNRALLFSMLF